MMSQSPQWPDGPAQPDQSPGNGSPLSRLARSRLGLTAIVTGVLIVALLGMLALVLSSNARGATPSSQGQTGQTDQSGQTQNGQAATASTGSGTPTGGGSSDGGGTHATPTPTPARGAATPTPTSGSVTGCCLTFGPSVHQVVSQAMLSGSSVGPVVATCPAGEIALSGGWSIPAHAGAFVSSSARSSVRSWAVYVRHGSSLGVTVYVECLANAPGATIVERAAYVSVAPGDFSGTVVDCNTGEVVVGGGFYSQTGLVAYESDGYYAQSHPTTWHGNAKNFGATSGQFGIYAECLTFTNAHSSLASGQTGPALAPGNGGRAASSTCPSGTYISGGGFYGPAGIFYDTAAEGSGSATTWAVYDYNNTEDDTRYVSSQAVCLGF